MSIRRIHAVAICLMNQLCRPPLPSASHDGTRDAAELAIAWKRYISVDTCECQSSAYQSGPQGTSMQGWPGFLTLIGFAANVTVDSGWEHILEIGEFDRPLDVVNCSLVNRRCESFEFDERGIAQCCSCHLVSLVCHATPLCSELTVEDLANLMKRPMLI